MDLVFQRLLLLSVRLAVARAPFDQCDLVEEELEAAQSMAAIPRERDQVRPRARLTFQKYMKLSF